MSLKLTSASCIALLVTLEIASIWFLDAISGTTPPYFSCIREKFLEFEKDGIKVYMPDLKLCTDNAAMIASAGYYNFISGKRDKLDLNAVPNIQLGN